MSTAVSQVEKAKNIEVRRVKVHSPSQLPADYGTTPGGTMFATTPGGTRIIYDRSFLLECKNSPLARSPLANLPKIPGVTCDLERNGSSSPGKSGKSSEAPLSPLCKQQNEGRTTGPPPTEKKGKAGEGDDPQFEMDM